MAHTASVAVNSQAGTAKAVVSIALLGFILIRHSHRRATPVRQDVLRHHRDWQIAHIVMLQNFQRVTKPKHPVNFVHLVTILKNKQDRMNANNVRWVNTGLSWARVKNATMVRTPMYWALPNVKHQKQGNRPMKHKQVQSKSLGKHHKIAIPTTNI
jgi:hypothetical protein